MSYLQMCNRKLVYSYILNILVCFLDFLSDSILTDQFHTIKSAYFIKNNYKNLKPSWLIKEKKFCRFQPRATLEKLLTSLLACRLKMLRWCDRIAQTQRVCLHGTVILFPNTQSSTTETSNNNFSKASPMRITLNRALHKPISALSFLDTE